MMKTKTTKTSTCTPNRKTSKNREKGTGIGDQRTITLIPDCSGKDNMGDSYRDLVVWQRAVQMSVAIYRLTANFPKQEVFGLTSQLRRAGVSVASNIAEGYGRMSTGEYKQFLGIARGSILEVQTQLVISRELDFGDVEALNRAEGLSEEVGKMLSAILRKL